MQFFEEHITDFLGDRLRVVWGFNEYRWLDEHPAATPGKIFEQIVLPKVRETRGKRYFYWEERVYGYYPIEITYNFERILFLTFERAASFHNFLLGTFWQWSGLEDIVYWETPPTRPFRFVCRAYSSTRRDYYLPATTESILTRDFKKFPPTEEEQAVWKYICKTGSIHRSRLSKKIDFLARYCGLVNSGTLVSIKPKQITL